MLGYKFEIFLLIRTRVKSSPEGMTQMPNGGSENILCRSLHHKKKPKKNKQNSSWTQTWKKKISWGIFHLLILRSASLLCSSLSQSGEQKGSQVTFLSFSTTCSTSPSPPEAWWSAALALLSPPPAVEEDIFWKKVWLISRDVHLELHPHTIIHQPQLDWLACRYLLWVLFVSLGFSSFIRLDYSKWW